MRVRLSLLGTCVAAAVAETACLQVTHFVSALPLAPQASALAPFGVFHDLRWAFTFAGSWWTAALMLLGVVTVRTTLDATTIRLAWPAGTPTPSLGQLVKRCAGSTLFAMVLLSPWAAAAFAEAAIGFSPFMLMAIIGSALTALFLPSAGVTGGFWRKVLAWRGMSLVAAEWLLLMLWSLAMTFAPGWSTLVVAAGAGGLNAVLWARYVGWIAGTEAPRHTIPLAPMVAAAVSVTLVMASAFGIAAEFGGSTHGGKISARRPPQRLPVGHRLVAVYVPGFDSHYDGGRFELFDHRLRTVHYSYRGIDALGRPRPYGPEQTHQPLATSAELLARQIAALRQRGDTVAVVAESEGTLVAGTYFAERRQPPPVQTYVQVSPLIRPGRVYFPEAGQGGPGLLGGWEAREMIQLANLLDPGIQVHADMPFIRSVVTRAALYRGQTLCPPHGVRSYLFLPMEGALTVYRGPLSNAPWTAFPAYHATLTSRPAVLGDIERAVLTGGFRRHNGWSLAYDLVRGAAGAWQAPALPLSAEPGGQAGSAADPAFGATGCPHGVTASSPRG